MQTAEFEAHRQSSVRQSSTQNPYRDGNSTKYDERRKPNYTSDKSGVIYGSVQQKRDYQSRPPPSSKLGSSNGSSSYNTVYSEREQPLVTRKTSARGTHKSGSSRSRSRSPSLKALRGLEYLEKGYLKE